LPDIWQGVEALWQQPLKARAPVAGKVGILRVQGRTETSYPGVPPLDESLATHLLPQAAGWAKNLSSAAA